ncbi:hypothetical protein AVEN_266395-1 [Araneus ventricosus]|uniref:Uncharacterized protein n=1 Tax=Araneus ventricosus TaxID=182803 RepID=A0A4Y2FCL4_ARAVE|nr:hypothetical protein AVEN_266395-1 [Araneus ventricosus]
MRNLVRADLEVKELKTPNKLFNPDEFQKSVLSHFFFSNVFFHLKTFRENFSMMSVKVNTEIPSQQPRSPPTRLKISLVYANKRRHG